MAMIHLPNGAYINPNLPEVISPTSTGVMVCDHANRPLAHIRCAEGHRKQVIEKLINAKSQGNAAEQIDWGFLSTPAPKATK